MIILELFCGTAGLTASFKRHGFASAIALDKVKSKFPHASVIQLDFTDPSNQLLIFDWIRNRNVVAIFMAPPCGTCSLARNIPIPDDPFPPQPLRSMTEPDGLRSLRGRDRLRVSQANILYAFCQEVMDLACSLNIACMIENPKNSLFWFTTAWRDVAHHHMLTYAYHQACAYGGCRPKWTCLCANFPEVALISGVCDNSHQHKPWGIVKEKGKKTFATALEVHYPAALCDAIVNAFTVHFHSRYNIRDSDSVSNAVFQASSGVQPAGNKLPPLFSPFSDVFVALSDDSDNIVWPVNCPSFHHAKLLHKICVGSKGEATSTCNNDDDHKGLILQRIKSAVSSLKLNASIGLCDLTPGVSFLVVYGFLLEPDQFVKRAVSCSHPFSPDVCLPVILKDAILVHCTRAFHQIATERAAFVKRWTDRALALDSEEKKLKATMDTCVAHATSGKRILLFREMLEELNYPDASVTDELQFGASLTGDIPPTGMLPGKFCPALLSDESLALRSRLTRTQALQSACSSGDNEIDLEVWKQTREEVLSGWLYGPIDPSEVGHSEPISRRFGIRQGSKIRPIDDFSASGVNNATSSCESPSLHTVDVLASLMCDWFSKSKHHGVSSQLVARTYDLKSAYRQVGLSEKGRSKACLAVFDPHSKTTKLFRLRVLPFGAVRSVHSFLRLARALWFVGTKGMHITWTNFYDDFVVLSPPELAASTALAIESLFKLTGWVFAETGKKCMPFAPTCQALGVLIDLSKSSQGVSFVSNTESRVDEVTAALSHAISKRTLTQAEARRMKGRMQFAEAQLFGRVGKRCIRTLTEISEGRSGSLSDHDLLFLDLFCEYLKTGPPREISATTSDTVNIFTDACYEKTSTSWVCGIGGVAVSPCGVWQHFTIHLDAEQRALLGEQDKKQIIFEAETLAAVVALALWAPQIRFKRSVLFVDNEGTKFSLIKGYADNGTVDRLSQVFASVESQAHTYLWISRVASFSNVADEPSRGESSNLLKHDSTNVSHSAIVVLGTVLTEAFDLEKGRKAQAQSSSQLKRKSVLER